jgi:D-arabinonate dehydratase/D-galactarolactone cycloisomerase
MRVRGHRAGFYVEAIAGVDIALWDLAGQAAGVPISTLLGGRMRESVRVYASGIPSLPLDAPDEAIAELIEEARSLRAAGYSGVKMAIGRGVRGDLRAIRAIRDGMGDAFAIYVDAAGVYSRADALRLGEALEELGVGFFEMPIPPEDVEGYAELAHHLAIPIALDSIMTRHETVELIRNRAIDIVQPDVCRAGGITECRRIAELADCFGLAFQPHVSIGSAVHVAASAHLAVAMPNSIEPDRRGHRRDAGRSQERLPVRTDRCGPGAGARCAGAAAARGEIEDADEEHSVSGFADPIFRTRCERPRSAVNNGSVSSE